MSPDLPSRLTVLFCPPASCTFRSEWRFLRGLIANSAQITAILQHRIAIRDRSLHLQLIGALATLRGQLPLHCADWMPCGRECSCMCCSRCLAKSGAVVMRGGATESMVPSALLERAGPMSHEATPWKPSLSPAPPGIISHVLQPNIEDNMVHTPNLCSIGFLMLSSHDL